MYSNRNAGKQSGTNYYDYLSEIPHNPWARKSCEPMNQNKQPQHETANGITKLLKLPETLNPKP